MVLQVVCRWDLGSWTVTVESRACPRMQLVEVVSPCLHASLQVWLLSGLGSVQPPFIWVGGGGRSAHVLLLQRELRFKLYILFLQPPVAVDSVAPQKSRQKGIWTVSRPSPTPSPRPFLLWVGTLRPRKEADLKGWPKVTQVGVSKVGVEFRPPDCQSRTLSSNSILAIVFKSAAYQAHGVPLTLPRLPSLPIAPYT